MQRATIGDSGLRPWRRCYAPRSVHPRRRPDSGNPEVPATTRTVNLTLEQRHVIRELVAGPEGRTGPPTT